MNIFTFFNSINFSNNNLIFLFFKFQNLIFNLYFNFWIYHFLFIYLLLLIFFIFIIMKR